MAQHSATLYAGRCTERPRVTRAVMLLSRVLVLVDCCQSGEKCEISINAAPYMNATIEKTSNGSQWQWVDGDQCAWIWISVAPLECATAFDLAASPSATTAGVALGHPLQAKP